MKKFVVSTWDSFNGVMFMEEVTAEDELKAIQAVHSWTNEFQSAEEAKSALFDSDQGVGVLEIQS